MMLWDEVAAKSAKTDETGSVWTDLEQRISYLDMVPRQSETAECIEVRELQSGVHFVLRDPERATSMKLAPEEYRIWDLIDGKHRVRDIVHIYLGRGGWFSFERISRFLDDLERNGLLETVHADVYAELVERFGHRRFGFIVTAIKKILDFSTIEIPWLDRLAEQLARWSNLVPRSRWILLTMAGLIAGSGGWLYLWTMHSGIYSPIRIGGSYGLGLTVLIVAYFIAVNTGQMVRAVGARILGFSLDQSQFRLGRRGIELVPYGADFALMTIRERALMNFGRMFALLVLGGLGGTISYFARPDVSMVGEFGFVTGSAAYLALFLEIMPFGGSAAYRLFSEWSGIPGLRSRAIRYVLRQMTPRILGRRRFKRSDKIMLFYCGWCVLWLAAMTQVCVAVVGREGPLLMRQVFEGRPTVAGMLAMAILAVMGIVTAVYAVVVTLFAILGVARYMLREGLLRRPGMRATASAIGWSVICLAMLILIHNRPAIEAFVCAGIAAVATLAAARLVRWRRDVTVSRYHWITATTGLLTLSFAVLGMFYLTGGTASPAAARLSDSTVIAVFVLLTLLAVAFIHDVSVRAMDPVRVLVVVTVLGVACSSFAPGGKVCLVAGILATAPLWPLSAAYGSELFSAWLLAWSSILVLVSGFSALWRPGVAIPYPVVAMTMGLASAWFDTERSTLRGIMRERDVHAGDREKDTTSLESVADELLAWYAKFCGAPFARTVRLRRTVHAEGNVLVSTATAIARRAGPRFAILALDKVMASLPWDVREEVDDALADGPRWLAAARLPIRVPREVRIAMLRGVPQVASLNDEAVEEVADRIHIARFRLGETIYSQGDPAHTLYIMVSGTAELLVEKADGLMHVIARFTRGDHFGGVSMLLADERSASVRAVSDTLCMVLDTNVLAECANRNNGVKSIYHTQTDLVERCRRMALFSGFTTAMLRYFLSRCRLVEYPAESKIVEASTASEQFSMILSGKCQRGPTDTGSRLLPGDCFGQETLLIGEMLTEITAIEDTELLVMEGHDFLSIVGLDDATLQGFAERLRRRMRSERVTATITKETIL